MNANQKIDPAFIACIPKAWYPPEAFIQGWEVMENFELQVLSFFQDNEAWD